MENQKDQKVGKTAGTWLKQGFERIFSNIMVLDGIDYFKRTANSIGKFSGHYMLGFRVKGSKWTFSEQLQAFARCLD